MGNYGGCDTCGSRRSCDCDLRAQLAEAQEQVRTLTEERDEASRELHLHNTCAHELIAALRDKWGAAKVDALTVFMAAFVSGISEEWRRNPPENGIVQRVTMPGCGPIQIELRKDSGKSAAERINEQNATLSRLREALRKFLKRSSHYADLGWALNAREMELEMRTALSLLDPIASSDPLG